MQNSRSYVFLSALFLLLLAQPLSLFSQERIWLTKEEYQAIIEALKNSQLKQIEQEKLLNQVLLESIELKAELKKAKDSENQQLLTLIQLSESLKKQELEVKTAWILVGTLAAMELLRGIINLSKYGVWW